MNLLAVVPIMLRSLAGLFIISYFKDNENIKIDFKNVNEEVRNDSVDTDCSASHQKSSMLIFVWK